MAVYRDRETERGLSSLSRPARRSLERYPPADRHAGEKFIDRHSGRYVRVHARVPGHVSLICRGKWRILTSREFHARYRARTAEERSST